MKKLFYLSILFIASGFIYHAHGQIRVNVNIGNQPLWGPVGYDYVRYYYMPEIDVYYDVVHKRYTYYQGSRWITKAKLPARYKKFDHYRTYKVVINDSNPWKYHRHHRNQYAKYANYRSQRVLRNRVSHAVHHKHKEYKDYRKHDKKRKAKRYRD